MSISSITAFILILILVPTVFIKNYTTALLHTTILAKNKNKNVTGLTYSAFRMLMLVACREDAVCRLS